MGGEVLEDDITSSLYWGVQFGLWIGAFFVTSSQFWQLDYEPKFIHFMRFCVVYSSISFGVFNVFKPAASCAQTGGASALTSAPQISMRRNAAESADARASARSRRALVAAERRALSLDSRDQYLQRP